MSDRHFYLVIAVIVITAWMFRFQIVPSSETDSRDSWAHLKLDRFTGSTYWCDPRCRKIGVIE
jgi:hypothetical protein